MKLNTNQEKLNDAVGMLDGEIVQTAMTRAADLKETRIVRHATLRRRAVVLLAACLSLTLMIGALLAIPLMTPHDPPVTSEEDIFPAYVETPMVRLTRLSSTEAATVSDPEIPFIQTGVQMSSVSYHVLYNVLTIDCEPGETVTVNADSNCLYVVNMPLTEDTDLSPWGDFYKALAYPDPQPVISLVSRRVDSVTFDPATSCVAVQLRMTEAELDETLLTFTVTDGKGSIVGVGSLYVGVQHLVSDTTSNTRDNLSITRSAVLGSVRFKDPSSVTEEQARELTEEFADRVDDCKAALDYSPVTKDERKITAMAEIVNTEFAEENNGAWGCGFSSWNDFYNFHIESLETGMERNFIIFDSGEWFEFLVHGNCHNSPCHLYCPNSAMGEHHAIIEGCRLTATDGRLYEYVIEIRDGQESGTLVPVSALPD